MSAGARWLALGLLLRLAFALKLGGRQHQIDEGAYFGAALELARTGVFPGVTPPVPAAFFAFLLAIGESLLWPRLGQAFVGTFTAWAVGAATEDLTGSRKAGRLATAVCCVYPFFIYYNGMVLSETLDLALLVPGLWLLCRALRGGAVCVRDSAAAGALLALAALCRAEGAFIMLPVWVAAAALCAARRWRWRAFGAGLACWALPLALWCARNQNAVGRFALDTHGGMTLLHGTVLLDLNEIDTGVAMRHFEKTELYRVSLGLPEAQRDALYTREALRFMRENPGTTLRQWARKLVNFWRFYPRADKTFIESAHSHPSAGLPRGALVLASLLFEPALILGGLYGLWLLRARMAERFPLYLWLLGTMGVHMVSVSQMRYRLPVMPVLILAAAYAVNSLNWVSDTKFKLLFRQSTKR